MPASDYLDDLVLRWAFVLQAMPPAPGTYVALFTAAPTKAGGGTEVSGGSYARVFVVDTAWAVTGLPWTAANLSLISFPTATASWGTVVAYGIFDAATVGNLLFFDTLSTSKLISAGDPAVFNAQALTIAGAV